MNFRAKANPELAISVSHKGLDVEARRQAKMMATARYFALYLEQRHELVPVFRAMRDQDFTVLQGDARDRAVAEVESQLGEDLGTIDQKFTVWFKTVGSGPGASSQ